MAEFICKDCGSVFDEREMKTKVDWLTDDPRDKEEYVVCPECGSTEFEEARRCIRCGEPFIPDDYRGYCHDCQFEIYHEYRHDPRKCYQVTAPAEEEVSINAFLAKMFSESEIEEILLRELVDGKVDCLSGIQDDADWFFECVEINEKEVKANETGKKN